MDTGSGLYDRLRAVTTSALADAFIEASLKHQGGANGTVDLIVVHGTVSPCVVGGARGNAHYFQNPAAGGAAHYVVDPAEIIGCVDENVVAHHAPPNPRSIGVEFCDWQGIGPQGDVDLWGDQPHQQMLGNGSRLIREIADRRRISKKWRTVEDLRNGQRDGITSHANVALAYHQSDHTDPGKWFPVVHFMELVTGGTVPVEPHPQEPDMQFMAQFKDDAPSGNIWLCDVAATGNKNNHDPTHKYGTRTRVIDPPTFYRLAALGIPTRSGLQEGMELFAEIV